jgi:hypothetical protein
MRIPGEYEDDVPEEFHGMRTQDFWGADC